MKKETRKKGRLVSRALSLSLAFLTAFSSTITDANVLNVKAADSESSSVYEQTFEFDDYDEISFDNNFVINDMSAFDTDDIDTNKPSTGELEEFDLEQAGIGDRVASPITSVEELTATNRVPVEYSRGYFVPGSGYAFIGSDYLTYNHKHAEKDAVVDGSDINVGICKLMTGKNAVVDIYDNFNYNGVTYDVRYEIEDIGKKAATIFSIGDKKVANGDTAESVSGKNIIFGKAEPSTSQTFDYRDILPGKGQSDSNISLKSDMRLYATHLSVRSGGYFSVLLGKNVFTESAAVNVKVTFYPSGTLKNFSTSETCTATPTNVTGWCIFSDLDYKEGVYLGDGFKKAYVWGTDETTVWGRCENFEDGDGEDPLRKGTVPANPSRTTTQKTVLGVANTDTSKENGGWITNNTDSKKSTGGNAGYYSQCLFAVFSGSSLNYTYKISGDSRSDSGSWATPYMKNSAGSYKPLLVEGDGGNYNSYVPKVYNVANWGSTLYSLAPNTINVTYYVDGVKKETFQYLPFSNITTKYVKDYASSAISTDGWYLNADKTGTKVAEGSVYSLNDKDVNLYGFTSSPSVTYVPNFTVGGKNYATPATNQVDNITSANITTRNNETFKITGHADYSGFGAPWVLSKWMTTPSTEGGYAAQAKGTGEVGCGSAYTVADLSKGQTFYGQYRPRIAYEGVNCTVKLNGGSASTKDSSLVDYNSKVTFTIVPGDKCVLQSVKKVDMLTGTAVPVSLTSLTLEDTASGAYYYRFEYAQSDPFAVKKHVYNSANQEIDKQPVELGEVITYTLTVGNKTGTSRGGVLTDSIPAGTTLVDGSISDGGAVSNGVISWNLSLPAGPCDINGQTGDISGSGVKTVSFKVKINDNCVDKQVIENFAKMHPTPLATDSSNLEDAESNHVHNYVADQFNKDHFNKKAFNLNNEDISDGVVRAGEEFRYEITVFNPCPQATTIDIVDTLPDGVDYISCSDSGVYTSGAGPLGQNQVKWSAISVPAEGTKTVSISVKMNEDIEGGIYVNEAVYKWTKNVDFSNPVYVTVYGLKNPKKYVYLVEDVTIDDYVFDDTKNQDGKIIGVGQLLTYRLTWSNPTVSERTINIEDTLPDGVRIATEEDYFKYLRGEELDKTANAADGYLISDGGTYDSATNKVTWSFTSKGDVIANDNGSVLFTVVVLDEAKNKKIMLIY